MNSTQNEVSQKPEVRKTFELGVIKSDDHHAICHSRKKDIGISVAHMTAEYGERKKRDVMLNLYQIDKKNTVNISSPLLSINLNPQNIGFDSSTAISSLEEINDTCQKLIQGNKTIDEIKEFFKNEGNINTPIA